MSKTLKDILKKKQEQDERNNRPKVDYFSVKEGSSVFVQFLQELGEDSPTYDKDRGSALFLVEHVSPYNFRRKAECTYDLEGRCFACEMNQIETKLEIDGETKNYPWSQRTNMYIQLITEEGDVKVLSRPAPGAVFDSLYGFAEEENEGSLTGQTFKISKGSKKNDKWELMPSKKSIDVPAQPELIDLSESVGLKVAYEEQKNFYIPQEKTESVSVADKNDSPGKTEVSW